MFLMLHSFTVFPDCEFAQWICRFDLIRFEVRFTVFGVFLRSVCSIIYRFDPIQYHLYFGKFVQLGYSSVKLDCYQGVWSLIRKTQNYICKYINELFPCFSSSITTTAVNRALLEHALWAELLEPIPESKLRVMAELAENYTWEQTSSKISWKLKFYIRPKLRTRISRKLHMIAK